MSNLALVQQQQSLTNCAQQESLNQSYDNCQADQQPQSKLLQNKRRQQRISITRRQKNQNLVAPQVDKKFPRDFFASHGSASLQMPNQVYTTDVAQNLDPTLHENDTQADLKNILINQQKLLSQHNRTQRKKKNNGGILQHHQQQQPQDCYSHKTFRRNNYAVGDCAPSFNQIDQQRSLNGQVCTRRIVYDQASRNQSEHVRDKGIFGNFIEVNNEHDTPSQLRQQPDQLLMVEMTDMYLHHNNTTNNTHRHNICNSIDQMLTDFNNNVQTPEQNKHRNRNLDMMQMPRNGVATSINEMRPQMDISSKFSLPQLEPRVQVTKYIKQNHNTTDLLTRKSKNNHIQQISSQQLNSYFSSNKPSKSLVLEQIMMMDPNTVDQNQLDAEEQQQYQRRSPSCPQSPVALARQELQRENQFIMKLQVAANAENTSTNRRFTTSKKQEHQKKMMPPQRLPSLSANHNQNNQQQTYEISSSVKKNLMNVIDQDPYANLQVKPFSAATADQNGSASMKRLNKEKDLQNNKSNKKQLIQSPPSTTFGNGRGFFDESTQISSSVQNNQFDISSGSYNNALKAFTNDLDPNLQSQINKKRQFKAHFEDLLVSPIQQDDVNREETLGTPTFKRRESTFDKQESSSIKKKNRFSNYRTQTTGKLSADESIQDDDFYQTTSIEDSTFNQIGDGL